MTATIGDLVRHLDRQVHNLGNPTERDTGSAHVAGWMMLAAATRRANGLLPLGGRSGQVKAGLRTVLDPLVHGPRDPLINPIPAPSLIQTSRTMGAIADVLSEDLRDGGRGEQIGTEAIKLEASLLSAVHVIACWSRAVTASQRFLGTTGQFPAQLSDLIVVTEPLALIPPERRASLLEDLRLPNPTAPGLEGAVTRWVAEATRILQERYRASGWAMQTIAGNLALLSHTAAQTVTRSRAEGEITRARAENLTGWFKEASRLWRTAAAWPPHIRLGGHTPILRQLGRDVRDACTGTVPGLDELRAPMLAATRLSLLHASTMNRLTAKNELWIHTIRTNYRGDEIEAWVRQPPGTTDNWPLVHAARDAHNALDRAVTELAQATQASPPLPEGWPPEHRVEPVLRPRELGRSHAPQRPHLDVGR